MIQSRAKLSKVQIERTLKAMNHQGRFQSAALTNMNGAPIVSAPTIGAPASLDLETTVAMIELVRDVIRRVHYQLQLAQIDEVSLTGGDGNRLVCRYFTQGGEDFLLAVMAPPGASHRRATTQAIREIKAALSGAEHG